MSRLSPMGRGFLKNLTVCSHAFDEVTADHYVSKNKKTSDFIWLLLFSAIKGNVAIGWLQCDVWYKSDAWSREVNAPAGSCRGWAPFCLFSRITIQHRLSKRQNLNKCKGSSEKPKVRILKRKLNYLKFSVRKVLITGSEQEMSLWLSWMSLVKISLTFLFNVFEQANLIVKIVSLENDLCWKSSSTFQELFSDVRAVAVWQWKTNKLFHLTITRI